MWVMKISLPWREKALLGNLARKHKVSVAGYPISHEVRKDGVYVIASAVFFGSEKKLKEFSKDLRKDSRTLKLEVHNNLGITYMKQHLVNKCLYQAGVIHLKPGIVKNDGSYLFELGSWGKNKLMKILKDYEIFDVKLHWIKQKKVGNVQVFGLLPELTERQKQCLDVAVENGYYNYPRGIELKELAKIVGVSYSTYQFHLRVAEKKVMPLLANH